MKKIIFVMLILSMLIGCKKHKNGTVNYTLKYSVSSGESKNGKLKHNKNSLSVDTLYTKFGDYITSLTPSRYIGNIEMIRFYPETSGSLPTALTLINNANLSLTDPTRFVDFSNNATVSVIPVFMGETMDGCPVDKHITFVILEFGANSFTQEVTLPVQYANVNLSQFNLSWAGHTYTSDSVKTGNILHVDNIPILAKLFNLDSTGMLREFYFGRTDTTSINFFATSQSIPALAPAFPTSTGPSGFFVWSSKYNEWTLNAPPAGQTLNINTTICIDTHNLIQVYAGADNIPYTSDDIFVYAPRFWERININVVVN